MVTYGEQRIITNLADRLDVSALLFTPSLGRTDSWIIENGQVRYLVIDHRLATALPMVGVYVEQGEPDTFRHTAPMALGPLVKFDRTRGIQRVFDSGEIVIYDVGDFDGQS
jgi:hypothetical protein